MKIIPAEFKEEWKHMTLWEIICQVIGSILGLIVTLPLVLLFAGMTGMAVYHWILDSVAILQDPVSRHECIYELGLATLGLGIILGLCRLFAAFGRK